MPPRMNIKNTLATRKIRGTAKPDDGHTAGRDPSPEPDEGHAKAPIRSSGKGTNSIGVRSKTVRFGSR